MRHPAFGGPVPLLLCVWCGVRRRQHARWCEECYERVCEYKNEEVEDE